MTSVKKGIVILGSTGSIGINTLKVIDENRDRYCVIGLSCNNSIPLLLEQIEAYQPEIVSVAASKAAGLRKILAEKQLNVSVLAGTPGNIELTAHPAAEMVVAAMVGAAGVEPVLAAIKNRKTVALANKEPLVMAGSLLMAEAERHQVDVLPIDSEHNAIFQALHKENREHVDHITLTASGGPFRELPAESFQSVTVDAALNHPNWEMGRKITVDSATMMNKCLEIIEARWLFQLKPDQIRVVIHPQSIVHSMVTFKDASVIAQLGPPDMKIPIAYCLGYPQRIHTGSAMLNLPEIGTLTFESPDLTRFPTLQLAFDVLKIGGGAPAALNGANEHLVELFLNGTISFVQIFSVLQDLRNRLQALHKHRAEDLPPYLNRIEQISDAIKADQWGRDFATNSIILSDKL